jgi:NADH:ubiquinone oxidoreductase subunit F (NADH-binding)
MTATHMAAVSSARPNAPSGLPRLLAGLTLDGAAVGLAEHRGRFAPPPRPGHRARHDLIELVADAGLRGRGGGSFPAATKLGAVAARGVAPIVVVNGSEGEPASAKDRFLITRVPHLVLDGAMAAAAAVGATEVIVAVDRANHRGAAVLAGALDERRVAGERDVPTTIVGLPSRFVAGEERALVSFLNGGQAKPTAAPPRVFERGVDGRPTFVGNVETLCHLAQIVQWGSSWFRRVGTGEEPGSLLATVSGDVGRPGVCEVAFGTSLPDLVRAAGGTPARPQAVLVGGYYGAWLGVDDAAGATLSNASLRPLGASVGCGAVVVLPAGACGISETAHVLRWMAGETAGQCGPCVHGLAALSQELDALAVGRPRPDALSRLHRWSAMVDRRGGCSFPDGAVRLLRSAMSAFAVDVDHHLRHGACAHAAQPPVLRVPAPRSGWR